MRRALEDSLNVPTVRAAQQIGLERVMAAARACGVNPPMRPVPSLALGTAEVRLIDVANAYAALGRMGTFKSLRVERDEPLGEGRRVYPEGAAYLALRSLGAPGPGKPGAPARKTGCAAISRFAAETVAIESNFHRSRPFCQ